MVKQAMFAGIILLTGCGSTDQLAGSQITPQPHDRPQLRYSSAQAQGQYSTVHTEESDRP